jgi:23S rRNA (guanosine2251-2'-O)-methyltransferase
LIAQANLAQAIERLKSDGVWVYGLEDSSTAKEPGKLRLDGALAIVVGNEAQGMRPLVRRSCDALIKLPMRGQIDSYNAAVAGSIALFLIWQARDFSAGDRLTIDDKLES